MTGGLSVSQLSKHHGPALALRDVSLSVAAGTVHGLVGGNGAGKSTLVRILAGVTRADSGGTVRVGSHSIPADRITPAWSTDAGLRFVHQDLGLFLDLTVAENLVVGRGFATTRAGRIQWDRVRRHAAGVLDRFGVNAAPDQPVMQLNAPDRALLAIARALQDQSPTVNRVVVLDEPTACLPLAEANRLLEALRGLARDGHSIVLISHRLDEITQVADSVSVLRDGRLVETLGADGLTESRLVELIVGDEVEPTRPAPRQLQVAGGRDDVPVLQARSLTAGPLRDVTFAVMPGEIVGVAGLLGSGRSRLLRALFGVEAIRSGEVLVDGSPVRLTDIGGALAAGIVYVPEDRARDAVFPSMTVRENLTAGRLEPYWRGGRLSGRAEASRAGELLRRYLIRVHHDQQPITTLSGGNQQKAVLARALSGTPRVMLLDEPSQGVDVHARTEIHSLVRRAVNDGAGALVVSSDFEELVAVCDRVIVLRSGHLVEQLDGEDITTANLHRAAFRTLKEAM